MKEDNIWNFKSQNETVVLNSVVIVKTSGTLCKFVQICKNYVHVALDVNVAFDSFGDIVICTLFLKQIITAYF